jgi:hypothetical protein
MPEQLTKHPDVTLQVLKSAGGARCGDGVAPQILTSCPAERFCALPGGEICVYGLPDAARMTQIEPAELRAAAGGPAPPSGVAATVPAAAPPPAPPASDWGWNSVLLGIGIVVGALLARRLPRRRGGER